MIAMDLAKGENMEINYSVKTPKFVTVNGTELKIDGVTIATVENQSNGIRKSMVIIISPDMSNDFILGYLQLKELHITFLFASYRANMNTIIRMSSKTLKTVFVMNT